MSRSIECDPETESGCVSELAEIIGMCEFPRPFNQLTNTLTLTRPRSRVEDSDRGPSQLPPSAQRPTLATRVATLRVRQITGRLGSRDLRRPDLVRHLRGRRAARVQLVATMRIAVPEVCVTIRERRARRRRRGRELDHQRNTSPRAGESGDARPDGMLAPATRQPTSTHRAAFG